MKEPVNNIKLNPESLLKKICIDFDKTIAKNGPHPEYEILEPIDGAWEALNDFYHDGWEIIIYTARPDTEYDKIADWLEKYDFYYDRLICGKPFAKYYIDDRAIGFNSWKQVMGSISKKEGHGL